MGVFRYFFIGLCAIAAINALVFTASTAIPLPAADAWYFIDTFVRKALLGQLQTADFFAQRGASDHAQPLHRLVLLSHLAAFDLDFRVEAIVGIVIGVVTCALIVSVLLAAAGDRRERLLAFSGAVAIFAVALSLNATNIYSWSLVSLIWISLLVAVAYWVLCARLLRLNLFALAAVLSTLAMGLVIDELAFPAFLAAVLALWLRDGIGKPQRAAIWLLGGGMGLVGARWVIHSMASGAADAAAEGRFAQLVDILFAPGAWKLLVGPLSDSLVHRQHLVEWFPSSVEAIQIIIALVLAGWHAAFWWRVFRSRDRLDRSAFIVSVAMMLFFYASIAGVALSRVTEFGIDYVHQPRYTAVYQLNVIALILMFASPVSRSIDENNTATVWRSAVIVLLSVVVALQLPLSKNAWAQAKYIRNFSHEAAVALADLGSDPEAEPAPRCPSILTVCDKSPDERLRILELLRVNRLSIYSQQFREKHGMAYLPLRAPGPASAAKAAGVPQIAGSCVVTILRRGPTRVLPGVPFNRQPDGKSAFWLMVPPDTPAFTLSFEGEEVALLRKGGVATYLASDRQVAAIEEGRPLRFDVICLGSKVTSFEVAVR